MKKLLKIILVFLILIFNCSKSPENPTIPVQPQPTTTPFIKFEKTFGGLYNDYGYYAKQTLDGGYIITGKSSTLLSNGNINDDVCLIKTDSLGNSIWSKTFGGDNTDIGYSVQQTTDNGYIIVGETYSLGNGSGDVYLIKTNSLGDSQWSYTFGGLNSDGGNAVKQTTDGGYIIAGVTYSGYGGADIYLIKTNNLGNNIWSKIFGSSYNNEFGYDVIQIANGDYIIVGETCFTDTGNCNITLIKIDGDGNTIWNNNYGGNDNYLGRSIIETNDGYYVIAGGISSSQTSNLDVFLMKVDSSGNSIWSKNYGGAYYDFGHSVKQTQDGGFIIVGLTETTGVGDLNICLIKTDSNGNLIWNNTFGGNNNDYGYSVETTTDGGYIIAGTTYSFGVAGDIYLIKTDSAGKTH
ncbi:MAG: hypothetical protein N3E50_02285 [Candidatus Goldbacteria bacterium]|nr:hypothetical protein [Candidatus Goldiibacteriota bacterium]